VGNLLSRGDGFSAHLVLSKPEKAVNMGFPGISGLAADLQYLRISVHREGSARRIRLIPRVVKQDQISWHKPLFWGRRIYMYLLFGPSMAALVVIAVIQLRDHFVASR
jgi:hypothetical protein